MKSRIILIIILAIAVLIVVATVVGIMQIAGIGESEQLKDALIKACSIVGIVSLASIGLTLLRGLINKK